MRTLILGRGGLLGSALDRHLADVFPSAPVPWSDAPAARRVMADNLNRFLQSCTSKPWRIMWVAGRAVTASPRDEARSELDLLEHFCEVVARARPSGPGAIFFASSAGGLYAGSPGAPHDEATEPIPLSAYGELKLAQEQVLASAHLGVPVLIGRIANLYGPGQDLAKPQGLITRLAIAATSRQPINLFVSLDTLRDYVYVDDAAVTILDWLKVLGQEPERHGTSIRIIASGNPVSLAFVMRLTQTIARTRIPIALGLDASARSQGRDLRLIPSTHPQVRSANTTSLPAGISRVLADVRQRIEGGQRAS